MSILGIGKALAQAYLARSNHIVDTSDASVQELKDNPVAIGSKLLLVAFESTSSTDIAKAIKEIEAVGISYIDLVLQMQASVLSLPQLPRLM